jgi:hypothetical protein
VVRVDGDCDQAAVNAVIETAPAKIKPAAIRMMSSFSLDPAAGFKSPCNGWLFLPALSAA